MHIDFQTLFIVRLSLRQELSNVYVLVLQHKHEIV